ncbi:TonB-dependent receptor [Longitalea luteola]|uniref:TonB-dependent receptor n=1 Tax=Longitalea luteola TaxID=2812563 RepID=UPI001A95F46C|nr:TonB-dependent receptor [Longitalea luteola]
MQLRLLCPALAGAIFRDPRKERFLNLKTLLIMKLTVVFLLAACLQVSAHSYGQRVTLSAKNARMEDVFKKIRKQTGFVFLYTTQMLANTNEVNIDVRNAPVEQVLKLCFYRQPVTYTLMDKTIIVKLQDQMPVNKPVAGNVRTEIRGRVTNESGQPLAGASITIKGESGGITTDNNGVFRIETNKTNITLVISSVGYTTREIKVQGTETNLQIQLSLATNNMEEFVVVGYGTKKKVHVTGSLSVLDMKAKENTPTTNASQALHGVSGVWINQAGGKPGQDVGTIRIRGVGTLNNNDPLVLVDGIEYNINEINPNFIESMTVLKDAAAAIYGSRAANGVILITTKTGKKGKMDINYNYSYGIQKPTFLPDVLWDPIQYMELKNQALINEGKSPAAVDYSPAQIEEYRNGMATDPYTYPHMNWFDYVMKNGALHQHNLRFSGGSDKITYNLALGYMDHDGILVDANHANRYTLNLNVSAQATDRLKVGANIIGNLRTFTQPAFGGSGATGYYFTRLTRVLPIMTPYLPDGRYGNMVFATPGRNTIENPIMLLKEGSNYNAPQRILAKVFAEYKLPFNLTYNFNFGVDKLDGYSRSFVPLLISYNPKTGAPNNYNINPASNNYDENNMTLSVYHTLNWDRSFGDHQINAMAGQSYNRFDSTNFNGHAEGYFDNALTDLNAGSTNITTGGQVVRDALISYFGRLSYNYKEKYLLEGIVRYDGAGRFAEGRRWGAFPSLSAGWRIDKENFFEVPAVNLLKLRASWGKLGNQAAPLWSPYAVVNVGNAYAYNFNNAISPGAAVTAYADPRISWETTTTYNGGVDAELLNGHLSVSVDVFKRRTSDILRQVVIPAQVGGLTGPVQNIGTVDNTGYEIMVGHRNKIGEISYEVNGSVSYVKNKVVDLRGQTLISARRIIKEGHPIEAYYLYQAAGIFQSQDEINNSAKISGNEKPGYLKYTDINKDNTIDGKDRIITGSSIPKYNYSFNINVGYKNFMLTSFWQGVQGINLYPTVNLATPFNNGAGVTKEWATDSWRPDNTNARLPIVTTTTGAPEIYQPSTFWLKDGSYMRLKNVQLRYNLPDKIANKLGMRRLMLFVNGENLVTFTKFKDFDPEKSITGDSFYEYPSLKTYSFGVNVNF